MNWLSEYCDKIILCKWWWLLGCKGVILKCEGNRRWFIRCQYHNNNSHWMSIYLGIYLDSVTPSCLDSLLSTVVSVVLCSFSMSESLRTTLCVSCVRDGMIAYQCIGSSKSMSTDFVISQTKSNFTKGMETEEMRGTRNEILFPAKRDPISFTLTSHRQRVFWLLRRVSKMTIQ